MAPRPAFQDKLIRFKPDRVFCGLDQCGRVASFLLYRYVGSEKPAVLAYCESHAEEVAAEIGVAFTDPST